MSTPKMLFLLVGLGACGWAAAQSHIYRCRDAAGIQVFQGKPCATGTEEIVAPGSANAQVRPGPDAAVPSRCVSAPQRFQFTDPALDGADFSFVLSRDASGYQLLFNVAGVVEQDDGPVPIQFSDRLGMQGLRFDGGPVFSPDFRRGDRELGYGHARTATLLDLAAKSRDVDAEIEPRGYAQSLPSAPMEASRLGALRSETLRCHLLRERVRKQESETQREQQAREHRGNPEAQ